MDKEARAAMGIRLPPDVRKNVEITAATERRSLNAQMTVLIERGLRSPETKTAEGTAIPSAAK